jgi:sirohydrochlorin cobaltochelatase
MSDVIVLAVHGNLANDFPRQELGEYFGLRALLQAGSADDRARLEQRCQVLDARLRAWPRTPANDPFWAASLALGEHLSHVAGSRVVVGFTEFCDPTIDAALDQAVGLGATRVLVVTPMLTRGGDHAERDIPTAIRRARERYQGLPIVYAWPYEPIDVAQFLTEQLARVR